MIETVLTIEDAARCLSEVVERVRRHSLLRAAAGFAIGGSVGFTLGILVGFSRVAEAAIDRSVQMIRAIPFLALPPLLIVWLYDRSVSAHAEWHWASGITSVHVVPALKASLTSTAALARKIATFRTMLAVLARTMVGPFITAIAILGFVFMPLRTRSRTLLWSWLVSGLAYAYVVVTVERVDYYLFPLLPLAALTGAGLLARLAAAIADADIPIAVKYAAAAGSVACFVFVVAQNRAMVAPYYRYSKAVYRNAVALDRTLAPNALVVMGHYDPSILYYINRFGWEEDPYGWTPFDEQSAIRKGARYFIDIEHNRFAKNVELCAWMQRFPILNRDATWIVYETDPAKTRAGAEQLWRSFRRAEKVGKARAWLDARGLCTASG